VKGYLEYLELHSYFAQSGQPKLTRAEFDLLVVEFVALVVKHPGLTGAERGRLAELKAALFRDKP
jgi:hypothetical protein